MSVLSSPNLYQLTVTSINTMCFQGVAGTSVPSFVVTAMLPEGQLKCDLSQITSLSVEA